MRHILLVVPAILLSQACADRPVEVQSPAGGFPHPGHRPNPGAPRGDADLCRRDSLVMFDRNALERVTVRPGLRRDPRAVSGTAAERRRDRQGDRPGRRDRGGRGVGEALTAGLLAKIVGWDVDMSEAVKAGVVLGGSSGAFTGGAKGAEEGEAVWERVTLLQIRHSSATAPTQTCRRPNRRGG